MMCRALALYGATIHGHPDCDAVTIVDGRILAIGRAEEVLPTVGDEAVRVDLHGHVLFPGFVDAHVHLIQTGLVESGWRIDLSKRSRADVLAALRDAAGSRGRGEWIVGVGWDESGWADRTYLARSELDRIGPEHPILAVRRDGHLLTANSTALERVPPTAPERLIERDRGLVREKAALEMLAGIVPDETVLAEATDAAARLCHRLGITSVHTMTPLRHASSLMSGRAVRRLRVTLCPDVASFDRIASVGLVTGYGDPWLRFGGIKIFADGSIGARNAAVSEPFVGGGIGELTYRDEEMASMIREAERAGWQTVIHAIGDRAIEQVLDAHETVGTDPSLRHRIEHFELPRAGQLARTAALGLRLCMQPNFIGEWSGPDSLYVDRLGAERDRNSNPLRRIVDAGIPLAFGSDGMPVSPLYGLHWAVNGPYPDQRLTVEEAIERYTAAGAWLGFEEESQGSIAPGMLADLVVLDDHPASAPERIAERTVEMTFVGGEMVYERGGRT